VFVSRVITLISMERADVHLDTISIIQILSVILVLYFAWIVAFPVHLLLLIV
jgi:hypothetical protein